MEDLKKNIEKVFALARMQMVNANPGAAYGQGYIHPNLRTLENYTSAELDAHKVASRKAAIIPGIRRIYQRKFSGIQEISAPFNDPKHQKPYSFPV